MLEAEALGQRGQPRSRPRGAGVPGALAPVEVGHGQGQQQRAADGEAIGRGEGAGRRARLRGQRRQRGGQRTGDLRDQAEPAVLRVRDHGHGLNLQWPGLQAGLLAAGSGALGVPQRRRGRTPQLQAGIDVVAAERDLRAHHGVEHGHIPGLVPGPRRRQLQLAFRLVVGAALQVGHHHSLAHPVRAGPCPERLEHRQRRAQVTQRLVARTGLVRIEAQLADPGVRGGPQPGAATALERGRATAAPRSARPRGRPPPPARSWPRCWPCPRPAAGRSRPSACRAARSASGAPPSAFSTACAARPKVSGGAGRQPAQAHQEPHRARPPQQEPAHRAEHQAGPGDLDAGGFRPERGQDPDRVPGQGGQAGETSTRPSTARPARPTPRRPFRHPARSSPCRRA